MATHTAAGHCPYCDADILVTHNHTSHILNLILSVLTCGLWLIPWLFILICEGADGWRCSRCGARATRYWTR